MYIYIYIYICIHYCVYIYEFICIHIEASPTSKNYGKQSYATERKLMSWGVGGNKVDQCNTQILLIQLKTL